MPGTAAMPTPLDRAYQRCHDFTRRRATNFYLAFAVLPPHKRRAIYAAYAFSGAADDAVDEAGSEDQRRAALAQAQTTLAAAYDGDIDDNSAEDDWLALALGDAAQRFEIPRDHFEQLLIGMQQDLTQTRYETWAELEQYCYRAASVIGLICIAIFGYDRRDAAEATERAVAMGKALQITNIMRDIAEDAERDRIYIAQEDLARHGYTEQDLFAHARNDHFRRLMADYAQRAYRLYDEGRPLLNLLHGPRSRMCCNGLQGVYRHILDAIVAADYDVYSRRAGASRPQRLGQLLMLWAEGALPNQLRSR